jgi:hypothetical protein
MKRLFISLLLVCSTAPVFAQPREIIVVRHAEKPPDPDDKGLSELGRRRAQSLVKFFSENPEATKLGKPAALFATGLGKGGKGQRCQQTLKPLSESLHLPVQTPFKAEENAALAKQILSDPKLKEKVVLICWTKERIPELMAAVGVRDVPRKLQEDEYDFVYLLTPEAGGLHVKIIKEDFRAEK